MAHLILPVIGRRGFAACFLGRKLVIEQVVREIVIEQEVTEIGRAHV